MLDAGCLALRSRLSSSILRKLEGSVSFGYSSSSRLRNIVKGLLTIGSNLSQTKEFRDLFEDILAKVAEPLEECGISASEMGSIISACYFAAQDIPELGKGTSHNSSYPQSSSANLYLSREVSNQSVSLPTTNNPTNSNQTSDGNSSGSMVYNSPSSSSSNPGNYQYHLPQLPSTPHASAGMSSATTTAVMGPGNNANVSMRSSDGTTTRSDISAMNISLHPYSSASAIAATPHHGSAVAAVGQSVRTGSTRVQSRASYMRADWLRFLVFCKLTLMELMMVDRRL
jgi:hypothetical protein